jgi:C-terminal processing protease CtpA/Prc
VYALGDRHSYLQSPQATAELRSTAVANARTRQEVIPPHGALLDERIAYVAVPSFAGGAALQQVEFAENIKNIIQQNDLYTPCGWILDLRRNTGGNLWPMLAGIGPLLGEGDVAWSEYPDGRRRVVWYRDGQAGFGDYVQLRVNGSYRLRAPESPVAVLTSGATASSAEVLAVGFKGRSRSRFFGAPTRGLSAGNRTFELADGATLVLTVAATSDRAGRSYPGPLLPDEPVASAAPRPGRESDSVDPVVTAALTWLKGQDSCS